MVGGDGGEVKNNNNDVKLQGWICSWDTCNGTGRRGRGCPTCYSTVKELLYEFMTLSYHMYIYVSNCHSL